MVRPLNAQKDRDSRRSFSSIKHFAISKNNKNRMDFCQALYFIFMWLSAAAALLAMSWVRMLSPAANVSSAMPIMLVAVLVGAFLLLLSMTEISGALGGALTMVVMIASVFILVVGMILFTEFSASANKVMQEESWSTKRTFLYSISLSGASFAFYKFAHVFT